ncbi:MAG TPA: GDSL-type esterase/lipase family protein [Humisphaera sp.]|jgi:beta-glucosidase|nr:GDSL-type esterase/lipase family protein [Humisphaera sp.]
MSARFFRLGVCVLTTAFGAGAALAGDDKPATTQATQPANRGSIPVEKDRRRHDGFMARKERLIKTGGTRLVLIGDSITDAWRSDPQREMFEDYFGQYRPYNIGISGDETQHVLWRLQHGELDGVSPKVAVIMIGTNNIGNNNKMSAEETADGIVSVVKAAQEKVPGIKILLLGVFPRANKADDPFRAQIKQINEMIAKLDDGGKHVKFLDIGDKFLEPDGTLPRTIMPDYLHPNTKGYEIWAEAIKPAVDQLEK